MKFAIYDNHTGLTTYHESLEEAENEMQEALREYNYLSGFKVYLYELIDEEETK